MTKKSPSRRRVSKTDVPSCFLTIGNTPCVGSLPHTTVLPEASPSKMYAAPAGSKHSSCQPMST